MTTATPSLPAPDGSNVATASTHLLGLIQQRENLRPAFDRIWAHLASTRNADDIEAWSASVLALVQVNAGAGCLAAFWTLSKTMRRGDDIMSLIEAAEIAANICRYAGAGAAVSCLAAVPIAQRALNTSALLSRWWRAMEKLAIQAPESVATVAARLDTFLVAGDIAHFEDFLAAGLKHCGGERHRRVAFFMMEDDAARRILQRGSSQIGFADVERATKAFATALWGRPALLRSLPTDGAHAPQHRAAIAGPLIRLPETYRGIATDAAPALYRAAAAHAQAHLILGGARFTVGKLKPLQITLVTLIEDARIETLAMREFPGLRRLWSPFHVAMPSGIATAPGLLARLARALFDPDYTDADGFVAKGRMMFVRAADRLTDPAISREIGMLLGNDLGQMRLQFNAKTYIVEPLYRDDGMGLWDFGDNTDATTVSLNIHADAVPTERHEQPDQERREPESKAESDASRAGPVSLNRRGVVIATYPEWDLAHGVERTDWTTVREVAAKAGDPEVIDMALERADILRARIRRLVGSVRVGRTIRLKRQIDGHDLDFDAVIDAGIALATRQQPDPRVFRSSTAQHRDLAVLVLIDISESTRDRLTSGETVLDVERLGVAVLAEAMNALGDPFCLLAFASNGRDDVEMTAVKHFDEAYNRACIARLAGLKSGQSTRLGAALRHAGATIASVRSYRKLIIVLTDGEPSDVDVTDPQELIEDARRAALGLKARGIDGFGVVLDPGGIGAASRIFGRGNTMLINRIADLPGRLSELYFRLARR